MKQATLNGFTKELRAARWSKALEMRESGATLAQIGDALGFGKERARQMLAQAQRAADKRRAWLAMLELAR